MIDIVLQMWQNNYVTQNACHNVHLTSISNQVCEKYIVLFYSSTTSKSIISKHSVVLLIVLPFSFLALQVSVGLFVLSRHIDNYYEYLRQFWLRMINSLSISRLQVNNVIRSCAVPASTRCRRHSWIRFLAAASFPIRRTSHVVSISHPWAIPLTLPFSSPFVLFQYHSITSTMIC